MTLILRAISLNEQPLSRPITARFDARGGTIGRADDNLLALPDPERHISRQQARISRASGRYRITNIGSANPILVGGRALGQGESTALADQDQVRIGAYLLEASEDRDEESASAASPLGPAIQASSMPASTPPRAGGEALAGAGQPEPEPEPEDGGGVGGGVASSDSAPAAARSGEPADATLPTDALWPAFCEGAGIRLESQPAPSVQQMRLVGALLRAAVDGSLELMAACAAMPQELRAQRSVIQSRGNNPLRFASDGRSALEQLLQPPLRGFLDGPAAMTEAMRDLAGRSIAATAGMRSALEGVLERYLPQALEASLSRKTGLDGLLPASRKAALWDLYLQHARGLRSEAQDDFEILFDQAFLAAYEQQLAAWRTPGH